MASLNELMLSYRAFSGVRLNMVIDRDLNTRGQNGSSRDISNDVDRQLLIHLRRLADVAITDAATADVEEYRPSKWVPIQIWSKSGNFRNRVSIQENQAQKSVELVHSANLEQQIEMTRAQFHHVLLETGPTLSSEIAKLGLIDEVCLTVSAVADIQKAKTLALEFAKGLGLIGFQIVQAIEVNGSSYLVINRPIGVA